jgi:YHS domain-containing protein
MKTILSKTLKPTLLGFIAVALLLNWPGIGIAFEKVNQMSWGVAIKGYDTVAYHTEGRAVKGQVKYSYEWNDAKWHFSSAENRDLFAADPDRYAPKYGGY